MYRILFRLGPVTLYSYGALVALAFLTATYLSWKKAAARGINPDKIIDACLCILVSGLAGARLFYVLIYHDYYFSYPLDILKIWQGGLIFYGGFIFASLSAIFFLLKQKIPVWKFADLIAPNISLGLAIGRVGCFLNGCCFGRITPGFGILFPCRDSSPVCLQQISSGLIEPGRRFSLPVIPTQLYSSAAALFIFLILVSLRDSKSFSRYQAKRTGWFFWLFVFLYGFSRFFIEKFRFYEANFYFFSLTLSQLISLGLILLSGVMLVILDRLR
ncbi:MAG: prolipoprotein diacylglyceryl transferase [Candidatus Ratteibacteria bacterium]|nr:prolipoprotein diacylglyceryl transferase [Candidatus Ratteibacteria bacterium]